MVLFVLFGVWVVCQRPFKGSLVVVMFGSLYAEQIAALEQSQEF